MSKKARVGDIASQIRGVTYSKGEAMSKPNEGYLPILRAMNITDHGLNFDDLVYVPKSNVSERQMLNVGDIVVAASSGSLEVVGKASVVSTPVIASFGAFCKVVRPGPDIYPSYLSHYFRTPEYRSIISRLAQGANINNLKNEHIDDLEILLPPLDDQKRIAALLDKADTLHRQRRDSLKLTEKLLQSVFIDMFVRNPDAADWASRSVEWMAKDAKGSMRTGPFGSQLLHSEFVDSGIAVLGIDNAVKNRFEWGQPRFVTPEKYQGLKRYKVFPGDLIITIMGTLGRCAIVPDDIPESINTKHLCCITLDHKKCLPEFLHAAFLNHPEVFRQLGVRSKGAVMPGLNMGIIKDLALPMPPIELQEEFKRVVALCTISRADLEDSQVAAEALFGSIQQRAFQGELDLSRLVLDPPDEVPSTTSSTTTVSKPSKQMSVVRFLEAPSDLEPILRDLDQTVNQGETIAWSMEYFKYRILASEPAPFTFENLMRMAETVFSEQPPYEAIRDLIFDLLGQDGKPAILRQRFDLNEEADKDDIGRETTSFVGRKKIVFEPIP